MNDLRSNVVNTLKRQEVILLIIFIAYSLFVGIVNPRFFAPQSLFQIVRASAGTMILAMGALVVLASGGIDVSFTAIAIFGGYGSVRIMMATGIDNIFFAFAVSGFFGILLGLVNAFFIHRYRLQTLIVTLGTQAIFVGAMTLIFGTTFVPVGKMPDTIVDFGSNSLLTVTDAAGDTVGLTLFVIPMVLFIILTWFMLNRTFIGRTVYALGSDRDAAERAGVALWKTRTFIYSYVGMLSGFMGIVYAAHVRSLNPISLVGQELFVITAVVLGGAKLTGGEGTVSGTVLGVLIITTLQTTLILIGLSSSWMRFFIGAILLISVSIMAVREKRKNERNLVFAE
jgi:simple sugar transport system permease protein